MNLRCGQHFVFPKENSLELMEVCEDHKMTESIQDASRLAQKCADDSGESFVVLQVVRIVNPDRRRVRED